MSDRENKYIDSMHRKFSDLLDKLMESDVIDWDDKEPILEDMKLMIDNRIRELHNKDFEQSLTVNRYVIAAFLAISHRCLHLAVQPNIGCTNKNDFEEEK